MVFAKERLRASGLHLGISACVALAAALLVFAIWYPYPYREVSGGRELFVLVAGVDVVLGPLVTLMIFNPAKPRRELMTDVSVVVCVQLAALAYGLWTVAIARPVHLAFEVDRIRVVHAVEVPEELVARTPAGIDALPWTGPTPVAVRVFRNGGEQAEATLQALQGVQLGARPDLWQPYDEAKERILAKAQPVQTLLARMPTRAAAIESALRSVGRDAAHTSYLPMISRKVAWTAFIDPQTARIVGFAPVDSF